VNDEARIRRIRWHLDELAIALEVSMPRLSECLVCSGWRLSLGGPDMAGIHYNISGEGVLLVEGHPPIALKPHMLVITPPSSHFDVQTPAGAAEEAEFRTLNGRALSFPDGALRRYHAGETAPNLIMICGYFKALLGVEIDMFSALTVPIVEQFEPADHVDLKLKEAMTELVEQEAAAGAMSGALIKQVLITLLRRSLVSHEVWTERFALLRDPFVARAFAQMVAAPGAPHRVDALARTAGLSRSAFMTRFAAIFGASPMDVLRSLRMRRAALLLTSGKATIDHIAAEVGYGSRSSFLKAFHAAYDCHPTAYRTMETSLTQ
jgi:AraC family transcriptional activator of mtrCDE